MIFAFQTRRDLLNVFQSLLSFWCSLLLLISFLWIPRPTPIIGLSNFLRTFWNPDFRRLPPPPPPLHTWDCCGGGNDRAARLRLARVLGSDRLLPNIAWFNWTSKESLSYWSKSVLSSSPNFWRITAISPIFSTIQSVMFTLSKSKSCWW